METFYTKETVVGINEQDVYCYVNTLTDIPYELKNFYRLDCSWNSLTKIPNEMVNLVKLCCYDNIVSSFPIDMKNLKVFNR